MVKKQEKAPKKLKARGFSAVAVHSAHYGASSPLTSAPNIPSTPILPQHL